jgi:MFS family permease
MNPPSSFCHNSILTWLVCSYLDRINVSNARLAGMQDDLGMNDVMWSTGISMFYVGYIISQIPANVIIAKGNPRILMPCCMLAWSVVTICMPAMKSGWSFCVCRFLVGFTEGPFFPAVSLMTSSWYTKHESPLRMGIWHAGNIISNVISGLLAAAVLSNMDGLVGLHAWQWFIILEGIVSIMVAIAGFWLLPNWPNNTGTYFFTAEESEMAQWRVLVSAGGVSEDDEGDYWGGVSQAIRDPFTWMFAALHFSLIVAQSFKDFFPSVSITSPLDFIIPTTNNAQIMSTLGFSKTVTYLIQAPPYIIAYFVTLGVSWSSGRNLEHGWHIICSIMLSIIGAAIMISTLNTGARYFSLILLCSGPFVGLNIHVSWETTVVPRPRTKRAALIAIANCVSSTSHWFTPYFFLTNQEPRYQLGGGAIIVGGGLSIISCLIIKWWCGRKNKALDKLEAETGVVNSWRFAT